MCVAEHYPVAFGPLGIGPKQVRYPPCTKLPDELHGIGDLQPTVQPFRVFVSKIQHAEIQADGERRTLDEGNNTQAFESVLAAHGHNVIQAPQRNPVVDPQKDNLACLQSQEG